ncbi:MAG: NUDIX hydrolase [Desulfosarcinaceae bacterium]
MTTASGPSEPSPATGGAYPDKPRVAVGAVVFRDNAVLLVKRGKPPGEGRWAIPGGSVRLGERLTAAAERELLEETGVTVKAGKPVLTFETIRKDAAGRVAYHYIIIDLEARLPLHHHRPGSRLCGGGTQGGGRRRRRPLGDERGISEARCGTRNAAVPARALWLRVRTLTKAPSPIDMTWRCR